MENNDKKKFIKSKLTKSVAVAATAAAVIGGGLTDDDAMTDLLQNELDGPEPNVEYVDSSDPLKAFELKDSANAVQEEKAPVWKSILAAPLWVVTHLLSKLMAPVVGKVVTWLFIAAAILAIVVLCLKAIFPDMPIKDLLSKKTIGASLIGAAVLIVADIILGLVCAKYVQWKQTFRLLCGLAIVIGVVILRAKHLAKKKPTKVILPQAI